MTPHFRGHITEFQKGHRGIRYVSPGLSEPIAVTPTTLTLSSHARPQALTLRGRWEADAQNRLTFLVERQTGRYERLTLQGGWEVGKTHELLYRYYRLEQLTRPRVIRTLTFRGYWDLEDAHRLTYVLDRKADSTFRFRGAFQTRSILAKRGALRYQLGIEVQGRRQQRTITLFGTWKLSRDLGVQFEILYGDERTRPITFGATFAAGPRDTITATLATRDGRPIGVEVIFSHDLLRREGTTVLRLRKTLEEAAVEGGLRFRW